MASTMKTVRFTFDRATKGAVRFAEVNESGERLDTHEATVGTLYIRKDALRSMGADLNDSLMHVAVDIRVNE